MDFGELYGLIIIGLLQAIAVWYNRVQKKKQQKAKQENQNANSDQSYSKAEHVEENDDEGEENLSPKKPSNPFDDFLKEFSVATEQPEPKISGAPPISTKQNPIPVTPQPLKKYEEIFQIEEPDQPKRQSHRNSDLSKNLFLKKSRQTKKELPSLEKDSLEKAVLYSTILGPCKARRNNRFFKGF